MKRKLKLNRETLRSLNQTDRDIAADQSCCDSCFFVTCGGGCQVSTGLKGD